jgi:hypothetical protein
VAFEPTTMVNYAGCVLSVASACDRGNGGAGDELQWRESAAESLPTTIAVLSTLATESDGAAAAAIRAAADAAPNANGTAALLCRRRKHGYHAQCWTIQLFPGSSATTSAAAAAAASPSAAVNPCSGNGTPASSTKTTSSASESAKILLRAMQGGMSERIFPPSAH